MSKFIIYSGKEWKHKFKIVSDDGINPEQLDVNDTATITISTSGANPECVLANVPMVLLDVQNGLFEVQLTADQTRLLKQFVGFQEDGFPPIGNYDGVLDFILVSGNRQSDITIGVKEVPVCHVNP